jgi:hypothetical protein
MLTQVKLDDLDNWTDRIDPLIERIAEESRGTLSTHGIWANIAQGHWWLAAINKGQAIVILEPIRFLTGKNVLEIVGLAGDEMKAWEDSVHELETIARGLGFHRLRAGGRRGWARIAAKHGWKETRVIIERELYDA